MCKDFGGKIIAHFIRKGFHEIPKVYVVPEDKCPPFLTPDIYLKINLENLKTPHRWKSIVQRIGITNVDNIIIQNKAIEIERKNKDYKKHYNIIQKNTF